MRSEKPAVSHNRDGPKHLDAWGQHGAWTAVAKWSARAVPVRPYHGWPVRPHRVELNVLLGFLFQGLHETHSGWAPPAACLVVELFHVCDPCQHLFVSECLRFTNKECGR
eukprot:gnl/TRDRNA2_/TRDRNA2_150813_c2_seq2.p1 gnl/TRDRNA2_/TRDRNA2_150813_c2~~gnl/TRDRNA2_/TRDRNA2_150813_c2_seq2.p1  ORF type:complete len:110 (-),score=7.28 gnl/TRDRNA2_/TRDRNA2_150813_c2_seq2:81-410(-)